MSCGCGCVAKVRMRAEQEANDKYDYYKKFNDME